MKKSKELKVPKNRLQMMLVTTGGWIPNACATADENCPGAMNCFKVKCGNKLYAEFRSVYRLIHPSTEEIRNLIWDIAGKDADIST